MFHIIAFSLDKVTRTELEAAIGFKELETLKGFCYRRHQAECLINKQFYSHCHWGQNWKAIIALKKIYCKMWQVQNIEGAGYRNLCRY